MKTQIISMIAFLVCTIVTKINKGLIYIKFIHIADDKLTSIRVNKVEWMGLKCSSSYNTVYECEINGTLGDNIELTLYNKGGPAGLLQYQQMRYIVPVKLLMRKK